MNDDARYARRRRRERWGIGIVDDLSYSSQHRIVRKRPNCFVEKSSSVTRVLLHRTAIVTFPEETSSGFICWSAPRARRRILVRDDARGHFRAHNFPIRWKVPLLFSKSRNLTFFTFSVWIVPYAVHRLFAFALVDRLFAIFKARRGNQSFRKTPTTSWSSFEPTACPRRARAVWSPVHISVRIPLLSRIFSCFVVRCSSIYCTFHGSFARHSAVHVALNTLVESNRHSIDVDQWAGRAFTHRSNDVRA